MTINLCALTCITNVLCHLANYKGGENVCELLQKQETMDVSDEAGWKVLQRTTFSNLKNVAPSAILSFSSSVSGIEMKNIHDGNLDTLGHSFQDNPCWVKLDIKVTVCVKRLVIHNRQDCDKSCYEKLAGFQLMTSVFDQPMEEFELIAVLTGDFTQTFYCNKEARFVLIKKFGSGMFHVLEVEILV